jgi:putative membrane protein
MRKITMLGYSLTLLATALSLLIVDIIFPGVYISTFPIALIAALAIGLVNAFVRPILSVLALPINFLTLGIFSLVINGICFSLAAFLVPGFSVHGILAFIFGPVILSAVNTGLNKYFAQKSSALTIDRTV